MVGVTFLPPQTASMSLSKDSKKILIECKRHILLQQNHVHGTD